jgi:hypothetical protein
MEVVRKFEFRGKQFVLIRSFANVDRIIDLNGNGWSGAAFATLPQVKARYAPYSSDQINRAIKAMQAVQVVDGLPITD